MFDRPLDVEGRQILARAKERLFGDPAEPTTIDRFVIIRKIGAGGMGLVYEAYDPELARTVALKLLRGATGRASDGLADPRRLFGEAQALARLSHPNAVTVYRAGWHDDEVFLAMELIRGTTLRAWLSAKERGTVEIIALLVAAGEGVAAAHREGIVHRDLKPENILVDDAARPKVVDFGLAFRTASGGEIDSDAPVDESRMTSPGLAVGTPAYMAPEQISGSKVGAKADQFTFCVVVYEALYGVRPFVGRTIGELRKAMSTRDFQKPEKTVPRVHAVLRRGLALEPGDRFPDMEALLRALQAATRRRWPAVAAIGVVAAGITAAVLTVEDPCEADTEDASRWTHEIDAPAVQARVTEWAASYEAACRSQQNPAAWELARLCFAERRDELAAVARLGGSAVDRLPSVDRCRDGGALARRAAWPNEAGRREAAEAVRAAVAEARALWAAGEPAADRAAEAALAEALDLGYRPFVADAHAVLGFVLAERGDNEAARKTLTAATWAAVAGGHDALVAEIAPALAELDDGEAASDRWRDLAQAFSPR